MLFDDQKESNERKGYRSFMLRIWQIEEDGKRAWRFSLERSMSGERVGFANLGELLTFLIKEICDEQVDDQV